MPNSRRFKSVQEFVTVANTIHDFKYTYNNFTAIKVDDKSFITCPYHGDFLQSITKHLQKRGCPVCAGRVLKTNEQFINEAAGVHGGLYDYSKTHYDGGKRNVTIICKLHGEFLQTPIAHLFQKQGCPKCGGKVKKSQDEFLRLCREEHGDTYDYSKAAYVNSKTKVTIICKHHGEFRQTPVQHYGKGSGCPKCNVIGSYSEKWFKTHPDKKTTPATLYIIKFPTLDDCYKIGITKRAVETRFGCLKIPYEIVACYQGELFTVFKTEQRLLRSYLLGLPKPTGLDIAGGESECFIAESSQIEQLKSLVEHHLSATVPAETAVKNLE